MKPTPMTAERYLSIINALIPKGWMPVGAFGSMTFRRNGKNYDLSAADLDQLERIEREGLFLAKRQAHPRDRLNTNNTMQTDQTPTEGNHSANQETEAALDDATCSPSAFYGTSEKWSKLLHDHRMDDNFHLGVGDIRMTFATQEDVVAAMEKMEMRLDKAVTAILAIEERYIDGCDTHEDWKFMGDTAREFLTENT